ncbi:hypothetical protein E0H48_35420 [Rhizobium leguminosarum bv. viciae]|nr:hypothetical protein E0H48_35420 [Rhizobium leguminosarum bv. viciae]
MPYPPSLHRSATLNADLPPIVSTGFLIQGEICAASARVTTDLTASAARRGPASWYAARWDWSRRT